jgi:PAS domain S-box-containing protein
VVAPIEPEDEASVKNAGQSGSRQVTRTAAALSDEHGIRGIHRLLFEQMSSAVAIGEAVFDDAGKPIDYCIVEVNPAFERLTGQKADGMIGKLVSEANPQMRPELVERAGLVTVSGEPAEFEGHDTKTDRCVLIRLSRVGPTWVMAMVEDVTETRRAEAALRERNAFVETIIASSGEGLVVFDLDLRYVVWNPRMEEMTGLAADRVLGRRARDVFPAVMAAGIEENLRRVMETGQPQSREFEYTVPQTGRRGWSLNTHRPHRDASGRIIGVIASVRDITARHEAEEALRQSEEQFRTIFDSMGDGVTIGVPGGHFIEVNQVTCERLGYTREQLLAMKVPDINSPESAALVPERVERILQGGVYVFETTHVRSDGTEIPIEAASRRIEFHGQPAILTLSRDITERKRSEEALREQARFVQQLLDAIPFPIAAKGRDGRLQLFNAAFAAAGNRTREQAIGKTMDELGIPDTDAHTARDEALLAGGTAQVYEALMPTAGSGMRRHVLSKAPLRAKDGEITGIVTAAVDIDDRYEAEQALRQSEERFRTLFDFASDAIFIHDIGGKFVEVNRTACERLGYSRDELLAMSPTDIDLPEFAALVAVREEELTSHRSTFLETAHVRREGVAIPVEVSATVIDLGGRKAILSIARDITERRQAEAERAALEDQLRQAQKMEGIGRLAGGIAHDFNNLLTAIRGSASLALSELPPGEGPREDLEQIEQAADRAARLTRQLLAFARRTVLQPEVVDLGEIVRRLEPMLSRLIGEDVRLLTIVPDDTGCVLADPGQIEQVILNLAVNASDAMPDGGTLTIEIADIETAETIESQADAQPAGKMTSLSVTDTGTGMDAETLGHLFEPFFTTKGPGKGTGLGLATVYGIVRQSGGTVTARSKPGHGSTFALYLPRVDRTTGASPEPSRAPATAARTATILVVEDDSGVRRFASRVLEAAGYQVLTAQDGPAAIDTARHADVQLLLTDVVMPGMSGRDVATRLSAAQPGIRVLYMSGHTDKGIVRDGVLDAGIDFLAKPFTSESLISAVDAALAVLPADHPAPENSAG